MKEKRELKAGVIRAYGRTSFEKGLVFLAANGLKIEELNLPHSSEEDAEKFDREFVDLIARPYSFETWNGKGHGVNVSGRYVVMPKEEDPRAPIDMREIQHVEIDEHICPFPYK